MTMTMAVTGGIGAGKSTVSAVLARLGAVVVDSDRLAREVVAPGTPGLARVVDKFGPEVMAADGSLDRAELTTRWSPSPYVSVRGSYEVNRLRSLGTRDSSFVTHLAGPEMRVFLNPRVQWSAFYQYNTTIQRGSLNARFSWEYRPLSYLYVVYNDRRAVDGGVGPLSRSLIVKLSWLGQL